MPEEHQPPPEPATQPVAEPLTEPVTQPVTDPVTEAAGEFAGISDGFERLWTPHRMAYVKGARPSSEAGDGCPFCAAPDKDDETGLVVQRGRTCYVVMNLFPYNPGHVLVCPYRHVSYYLDLTDEETAEYTALTKASIRALQDSSAPHGFNIGMNQGDVAGAGVAAHLHQHVVPRWGGDANFLPIVGQTKALPMLLEDVRRDLVAAWPTAPTGRPATHATTQSETQSATQARTGSRTSPSGEEGSG